MIFTRICPDLNTKKKIKLSWFHEKKTAFVFLCVFVSTSTLVSFAQIIPLREDKDLFFSVNRVALKPELVSRLTVRDDGRAQRDIAEFAGYYGEGYKEYSLGNFTRAADNFKKARFKWPEYFYADFAIALDFDADREYGKAARYYKSYLNKLGAYKKGYYGISAPLIVSFASGRIEDYDYAYGVVEKRLSAYGIKLARVRPAYSFDIFPIGVTLFFLFAGFLLVMVHLVIPFIKRKVREKNPPEGYWVCPGCGTFTPDLSLECSICGRSKHRKQQEKDTGETV